MLSIIVAKSENNVIGAQGSIPWHLSADLKRFKEITRGHPVVMGRKTFESILSILGKPLPGRRNVVVTRNQNYYADGVEIAASLEDALHRTRDEEAFVIGGTELYREALSVADVMYLTVVHTYVDGDAFFPDFSENEWRVVNSETHKRDEHNDHDYTFLKLIKQ